MLIERDASRVLGLMRLNGGINLNFVQTFLLVAEHASFRVAAEKAHRSQSAISMQIKQLESQFGTPLFHRTTRRVRLTHEGEQLFSAARRAFGELELAARQIEEAVGLHQGRLFIACSQTVAATRLPRILAAFEQDYPGIAVHVRELPSTELLEAIRRQEVDFGIGPVVPDSELSFEPILRDEFVALVPDRLLKRRLSTITLARLCELPVLLLTKAAAFRATLDAALRSQGLTIPTRYEVMQTQTMIAMARAGLGVAILPKIAVSEVPLDRVQMLRIVEPTITRDVAIVTLRGQGLSPAAARLTDLIREGIDPAGGDPPQQRGKPLSAELNNRRDI